MEPVLLMIDSADSRDRDDAITARALPDGSGWAVQVHVAAVADVVPAGSRADEQAFLRGETRYLRTRTVPMLGPTAEAAATLTAHADRTTLRVSAVCNRAGVWHDVTVTRELVPTGACVPIDHQQARHALDAPNHVLHETITALHDSAQTMLAARRQAGALAIYDLLRGWATTEDGAPVTVAAAERTIAYVIVQEFMIAANRAIATWCIERGLPILFRTHRRNPVEATAAALTNEFSAAASDPGLTAQLQQRLSATVLPARYEAVAGTHHGLRLAAYTHATSPLRRLADLVTQRVLLAHLDGTDSPYTPDQLALIGDDLDRRTRDRKDATSARHKNIAHRAVAVDAAGDLAALTPAAFTKVLKALRDRTLQDGVAEEITARVDADTLTIADWVLLVDTTEPTWHEFVLTVVPIAAAAHPEWAPSITAGWAQLDPTRPVAEVATDTVGPPHKPQFTSRAVFAGTRGARVRGVTKKRAEQDAVWSAITAHLTGHDAPDDAHIEPADVQQNPIHAAIATESAPSDATPAAVSVEMEPGRTPAVPPEGGSAHPAAATGPRARAIAAQLVPAKLGKALKNPVAWLNSLAIQHDIDAPVYDSTDTGSPGRTRFTTTASFADATADGAARAKTASRIAAAETMIERLFRYAGAPDRWNARP